MPVFFFFATVVKMVGVENEATVYLGLIAKNGYFHKHIYKRTLRGDNRKNRVNDASIYTRFSHYHNG